MKYVFFLFYLTLAHFSVAQPGSEIYLFDISVKKDRVTLSNPVNITNHKGYDNQPFFHPHKSVVYYASANEEGRTDILSYDYKNKTTVSVTKTSEKEYSPTLTLDEQYISCIIQRDDGTQDLGKYPIDGGEPSIIINNLKVGYHVWADNSHLGLFVLGTPNQLHYIRLPTQKDTILSENIGRSLLKVPGESAFSFIHKYTDKDWFIKKINSQTMQVFIIGPTVAGSEDLCWLMDGKILMSDGPKLYFMQPSEGPAWNPVIVSSGADVIKGVTRLAVSGDGKKLALVVAEP